MANVAVVGVGLAGLGAVLVPVRRAHKVALVESDTAPVPSGADELWPPWRRPGVARARHFAVGR